MREYLIGNKHRLGKPAWNKGIGITPNNGYLRKNNSGKYIHRAVVEEFLGRPLTREEQIHHIDGNKLNNDISNLKIVTPKEHQAIHLKDKMIIQCVNCGIDVEASAWRKQRKYCSSRCKKVTWRLSKKTNLKATA